MTDQIMPPTKAGNFTEAAPDKPDPLLIRIEVDWRLVAHGDKLDALKIDLKALKQRDTAEGMPADKFEKDMTVINDQLSREHLLPNMELIGVRDNKIIVADKKRHNHLAALQPGLGMVQVVDLTEPKDPTKTLTLKRQTSSPNALRPPFLPSDVNQGEDVPDCRLTARLASLAIADPAAIARMIKDNKNGTYTVTFRGDKQHPETVLAPTDWERSTFANGFSGNQWALILDKAYRQRTKEPFGPYKSAKNIEGLLTGSPQQILIPLLFTKCDAQFQKQDKLDVQQGKQPFCPANYPKESVVKQLQDPHKGIKEEDPVQMGRILQEALSNHMMVSTSFNPMHLLMAGIHRFAIDDRGNKISLEDKHAYTVTKYDPKTETVRLRNPWAVNFNEKGKEVPGGNFKMPLMQFTLLTGGLDVEMTERSRK